MMHTRQSNVGGCFAAGEGGCTGTRYEGRASDSCGPRCERREGCEDRLPSSQVGVLIYRRVACADLGQVGDHRRRELLRLRAAALAQRDQLGHAARVDDRPLVVGRGAQMPDCARGVLLSNGAALADQPEQWRHAIGL